MAILTTCIYLILSDNTFNNYQENGQIVDGDFQGDQDRGEIIADITSSFVILLAIFFPSCTGDNYIPFCSALSDVCLECYLHRITLIKENCVNK